MTENPDPLSPLRRKPRFVKDRTCSFFKQSKSTETASVQPPWPPTTLFSTHITLQTRPTATALLRQILLDPSLTVAGLFRHLQAAFHLIQTLPKIMMETALAAMPIRLLSFLALVLVSLLHIPNLLQTGHRIIPKWLDLRPHWIEDDPIYMPWMMVQ